MTAWEAGAAVALVLLLTACSGDGPRATEGEASASATPGLTAGTTPTAAGPTATPDIAPPTAAPTYGQAVPPPATPAGADATRNVEPPARAVLANVSFKAVNLGLLGDRYVVVYPQVYLTQGTGTSALHVKLPFLSCDRRAGDRDPDFYGCRDRRVEYGDLVQAPGPAAYDGRRLLVDAVVPTYTYSGGTDRDVRVRPAWTGRAYRLEVQVAPQEVLQREGGTLTRRAAGVVRLDTYGARDDAGYINIFRTTVAA